MKGMNYMGKNKVFLKVDELKEGMIIAEEVKIDNAMLLASGVTVTKAIIKKLTEKFFFGEIAIYGDKELDEPDEEFVFRKEKTIEEIGETFNKFTANVESLFTNINNRTNWEFEEIRAFAKRIQQEMKSTNSIIKNIVLYGSGDDSIYKHSVNVAVLSSILGKWIGLSSKDINLLTFAGILHDFGKTKINREILDKVEPLTSKEIDEIKNHPVIGYNFTKTIPYINKAVCDGVLMHHERLDGSGYPLGIKEDRIHVFAKIIAITDIFDAINSNRVYKNSTDPFNALEIIYKESLGKLDYKFCKIFIDNIINYYMGEKVLLNTEKVCKIVQINVNDLRRPLLFDGDEFIDLKLEKDLYVKELIK